MKNIFKKMNEFRKKNGFYTIDELCELTENYFVDYFSVIISRNVSLGSKNSFYPGTAIICDSTSKITIGNSNTFMNSMYIEAKNNANIKIGNNNIFDHGPVSIKCNIINGKILIEDNCRLDGKINIFGNCVFENGSQVLGTINVYNCKLRGGGSYLEPDPEKRAGLLKGIGTARNIIVNCGQVLNGFGDFREDLIESQLNYHK